MNLLKVEKPTRYMGGELGSICNENRQLRFALAFPDVYEIGMSHLGLKILYKIINDTAQFAAERVFAPWPDMEQELLNKSLLLTTLESATPLCNCDIVGFTLPYELSYSNIVNMLKLGGIPVYAADRGASDPIIVAGGPCAYNPEPVAEFFDAILIGDGEEAVLEIAEIVLKGKMEQLERSAILAELAKIEGVYIPSLFRPTYNQDGTISGVEALGMKKTVRRRFLADLDAADFPMEPVVPFMKTVHDRVAIEVARGCTRGCRFCQAGFIYRPLRERKPETVVSIAEKSLASTGYEELSLLSLSTGDYACIEPLLKELMHRHADDRISVSLPSLRVGTLTDELIDEVKKVRKTGFTLAPEAGSERMRRVINKGIAEEDLLETAYSVYRAGWRAIKLYFMIGLPTETDDDILQIALLARKVKDQGRRAGGGGDVAVSVSNFVPKPHTPFQWQRQLGIEETRSRQLFLDRELKQRKLRLKWHDAPLSFLEGVFARGDRRLAAVIVRAVELGCRFDGWREHFRFDKWLQAFRDCGIDPEWYLRERSFDEKLPWDHIDCGVTKNYLIEENKMSGHETATADCRFGDCTGCGVCDFDSVTTRRFPDAGIFSAESSGRTDTGSKRIRLRFSKRGKMVYLSHLDLITLFTRAVSKGGVKVIFTQGFHPHPKFSFATATSVGVESDAEYMDAFVADTVTADEVKTRLNTVLPAGMAILEAAEVPNSAPSLSTMITGARYRIRCNRWEPEQLAADAAGFMAKDSHIITRKKKGESQQIDLRLELSELSTDGNSIVFVAGRGKPVEFAREITGNSGLEQDELTIEKLDTIFI